MTNKHMSHRKRKILASIAASLAAITLGFGGYAVANSGSSSGAAASATTAGAKVVPFQKGQPGLSKTVGRVPAAYNAGSGTIVTGTAADKAKAAAVAAYPGGTVNRVVLLSDGNYNVHIIGVNWPHHVFLSSNFIVVGAQ